MSISQPILLQKLCVGQKKWKLSTTAITVSQKKNLLIVVSEMDKEKKTDTE